MNKWLIRIFILISGVVPLGIVSYILSYNLIPALHHPGNLNDTNMLFNGLVAFGTILLAIATFTTLYITVKQESNKNEQLLNQYNKEHLKNIKEILNMLQGLIKNKYLNDTFFEINEGMFFDENDLQRRINSERHSYDEEIIYNNDYKIIVNNKIYKDLENHKITKGIPDKLEDLLKSIKNNTPKYIKGLANIFIEIGKTEEYKKLEKKISDKYYASSHASSKEYLEKISYILILAILLGYQNIKYKFPNYLDSINQVDGYENIEKIAEILRNGAEETIKYREEIKKKLDDLVENIKNALEYDNLLDECEYLKTKREIIVMK